MKFLGSFPLLILWGSRAAAALTPGLHRQQQQQQPLDALASPSRFHDSSSSSSSDAAPPYRESLVSLHRSLVEIPSISGDEGAVGEFLVDYLSGRGFVVERQFLPASNSSSSSSRFNVLAWRGKEEEDPQPRVIVTSHLDVVPPYIPYSTSETPVGPETTIAGRGSVDAKAAVAAQVTALEALLEPGSSDGPARASDVLLLFVVGEETRGDGMRYFSGHRGPEPATSVRAVVFGEPTEGRLACGHKGIFACDVTARGRAGHSGYPWLGKSATEALMRGLVAVLDADLGSSAEFGNTTVNVGALRGGVANNVIAAEAGAQLAGRVAIGPESDGGRVAAGRLVDVLRSVDPDAFDVQCFGDRNGYGVVRCNCDVEGFETITVNYGTDVPNLAGNHTRYLYGPGSILVAHGADEALKLKDLEAAVEGYKKLILHALKDD